jgi:hypothetical protein
MLRRTRRFDAWRGASLLAFLVLLVGCGRWSKSPVPSISFSRVPPADKDGYDKFGTIEGIARGFHSGQQIVLYSKSEELWWLQPVTDHPFTNIQGDSTWKSQIHLGTEYAALLVDPGYNPPETSETLPSPSSGIEAAEVVKGQGEVSPPASPKTVNFSGYEWTVRTAGSNRAGTKNSFSAENAWTDDRGALHLRIAKNQGKWTCAEVKLVRSLGYGTYSFVVRDISQLEPSAVLTLLTWDGIGGEQNRRELDVEISRWGYQENENAHYVVQPYFIPANMVRFRVPGGVLTHSFEWKPGRAAFSTVSRSGDAAGARVINQHVFTSGVPSADAESVRMNLYVFNKGEIPLKNETEVVIEKFEYLP